MADRRRPPERSDRLRGRRTTRHAYRHPVYGGQARRERQTGPYVIGFVLVVIAIAAFLYVGLNWATGQSRVAALASPPTNTPVRVVAAVSPSPSPSPNAVEQTYIVQAGDNPATIAQKFRVKTEDLMALNNIEDPSKLQIGQTLKIPATSSP